jgi:insulysin
VRTFAVTQPAFDRKLDLLRRQLRDAAQRQPVALASYHRNLATQRSRYSNEQLSEAAAQVTLSDVAATQAGLIKASQLEVLVTGNLREAEAAAMVRQVADALPTSPLLAELVLQRRVRVLPLAGATQQWVAENPDEANSALELYLQVGTQHL